MRIELTVSGKCSGSGVFNLRCAHDRRGASLSFYYEYAATTPDPFRAATHKGSGVVTALNS
jgi:hypothetical protein